jgi:hypothetical protein
MQYYPPIDGHVSKTSHRVEIISLNCGLLFIPQVMKEYGEPRWNDIDRRKLNSKKPVPVPLCPT